MRNVKLLISYDGTNYSGFQSQVHGNTIEDIIRSAITKITGCEVQFYCAGRTDGGVHAEGQVINFFTDNHSLHEDNWIRALNSLLPRDIRVNKCEFVSPEFNSRRSAIKREYWYYLVNSDYINALQVRFASHWTRPLDIELLRAYAAILVGEHDFTSFCSTRDESPSKVRRIESFIIDRDNDIIIFKIIGNAFLMNMVRTIVGTLIDLARVDADPGELQKILEAKDRKVAGQTFFSRGLVLKKVYYE